MTQFKATKYFEMLYDLDLINAYDILMFTHDFL